MTHALELAGLALATVFAGMTAMALLTFALRALARRAAPGRDTGPVAETLDPRHLSILAAAAHAALGARIRIHRVHIHREPAAEDWSRAGRIDILSSHRVAPKR